MFIDVLFYIFAFILVFSALRVITTKNPVHSVLFLVLSFITMACLWMMLNAEFLALALIVIYVGAVMVLFLFVVMMLDINVEEMRKGFWKNLPIALLLGLVVLVEIVLVLLNKFNMVGVNSGNNSNVGNTVQLGWVLYSGYSYPVELASIILLLGLVAAVALTLRKTDKNTKYQNIRKQVSVNPQDRIKLVEMVSEVELVNNTKQEKVTK